MNEELTDFIKKECPYVSDEEEKEILNILEDFE